MARTLQGAVLTAAHRRAQETIGRQTITAARSAFALLNPVALDSTVRPWLHAVTGVVKAQRVQSARVAAAYVRAFHAVERPGAGTLLAKMATEPDIEALTTSLLVTGPYRMKNAAARGLTVADAARLAQDSTSRAASRHAINGGRETVMSVTTRYARITSGSPCAFCEMLASRGAVYLTAESAGEGDQWHDGCHCFVEPEEFTSDSEAAAPVVVEEPTFAGAGEGDLWLTDMVSADDNIAGAYVSRASSMIGQVHKMPTDVGEVHVKTFTNADAVVTNIPGSRGAAGFYSPSVSRTEFDFAGTATRITEPGEIGLNAQGGSTFTLLHETGHMLDNRLFAEGGNTYFSWGSMAMRSDEMVAWGRAADGSVHIQGMRNEVSRLMTASQEIGRGAERRALLDQVDYLNYLLEPREIFARSYSQWVAEQAGSEGVIRELASRTVDGTQWPTEDFKPIASTLDKLFKAKGLR